VKHRTGSRSLRDQRHGRRKTCGDRSARDENTMNAAHMFEK
jgi:hypothetical protein